MRRSESVRSIVYGPVVIGYSVTIWSKGLYLPSGPRPHLCENTGSPPIAKIVSLVRSLRSKRIVRASSTVAPATPSNAARTAGDAAALVSMSNACFTSSVVTGSPLVKRAAGLIRNVTDDLSGATRISSAMTP